MKHDTNKRDEFFDALKKDIAKYGLVLVEATLGRLAGPALIWNLTVSDYTGQLWTMHVPLARGVDPYSASAREIAASLTRSSLTVGT